MQVNLITAAAATVKGKTVTAGNADSDFQTILNNASQKQTDDSSAQPFAAENDSQAPKCQPTEIGEEKESKAQKGTLKDKKDQETRTENAAPDVTFTAVFLPQFAAIQQGIPASAPVPAAVPKASSDSVNPSNADIVVKSALAAEGSQIPGAVPAAAYRQALKEPTQTDSNRPDVKSGQQTEFPTIPATEETAEIMPGDKARNVPQEQKTKAGGVVSADFQLADSLKISENQANPVQQTEPVNGETNQATSFYAAKEQTDGFSAVIHSVNQGNLQAAAAQPQNSENGFAETADSVVTISAGGKKVPDASGKLKENGKTAAAAQNSFQIRQEDKAAPENRLKDHAALRKSDDGDADKQDKSDSKTKQDFSVNLMQSVSTGNNGLQIHKATDDTQTKTHNLINQTADALAQTVQSGKSEMRIHLSPEDLGGITIKMISHNGALSIRITADNRQTGQLLAGNMDELHKTIRQYGITMDKTEVFCTGGGTLDYGSQNQSSGGQSFNQRQNIPLWVPAMDSETAEPVYSVPQAADSQQNGTLSILV